MAVKDFIISFFAGSPLLRSRLNKLQSNYLLFEPQVSNRQYKEFVSNAGGTVMGMWNKARAASDELGRVAVIGFSEGCQGVSAVLDCPDASAIDVVIPVDGIHRQFTDMFSKAINPVALSQYIAFAKLAAGTSPSLNPDTKLMVITHSSIGAASLPVGMASTTQTAQVIWSEALNPAPSPIEDAACGYDCPAAVHSSDLSLIRWPNMELPLGTVLPAATITNNGWTSIRPQAPETGMLPSAPFSWSGFNDGWKIRRIANNLYIFGWVYDTTNKTKDPTGNRDHVFQAQMVLPAIADEMLVTRWNPSCASGPPVMGFGADNGPIVCNTGRGKAYGDQTPAPLTNPYPLGVALPVLPDRCPVPASGTMIIGRPGDPCYTGPTAPDSNSWNPYYLLGGVAAGAAGYYGAKYLMKAASRWRR